MLLRFGFCLLLLFHVSFSTFNARGSKPNVVLIFADDLGMGDLGAFGHPTSRTPNIDTMMFEGQKLTQYYSGANICSPSRASLLTGKLFPRLGVWPFVFSPLSKGGLLLNFTTIAKALKPLGYTSGMVGKWHLGVSEFLPTNHGFDHYFGCPMTQNTCYSNIRSPGSVPTNQSTFGPCPIFNGSDGTVTKQSNGTYPTDPEAVDMLEIDQLYDEAAEIFIRDAVSAKKPFFFYFSSHHTHAPQFSGKGLSGSTRRGLFGDSLYALDRSVGRMLSLLKYLRIDQNTLVIFTSDNGGSLFWQDLGGTNGDFRCGKGTTWEGGQRVPASIWWPGVVPMGGSVQGITSSLDWFPTILSLAGGNIPLDLDGKDLTDYLFNGGFKTKDSPRQHFFYHSTLGAIADAGGGLMAVRVGKYKLHFYTQGAVCPDNYPDPVCSAHYFGNHTREPLLYNLETDPSELKLINYTSKEYKSVVPSMIDIASEHMLNFHIIPSQVNLGLSADRFPCCNPECSPKPTCCKCMTTL